MRVALVLPGSDLRLSSPTSLAGAEHLGLGSIAAHLRRAGHEVAILNLQIEQSLAEPPEPPDPAADAVQRLLGLDPEVIGMSITNLTLPRALELSKEIKHRLPGVLLVWGSHQASSCAAEILDNEPAVDLIVAGDGEIPMLELLSALEQGRPLATVAGLWYRQDGSSRLSAPPPEPDLDALAWPDRDSLQQLVDHGVAITDARISSSRGCPFHCAFCVYPALSYLRRWRERNPQSIVEEMRSLIASFGIKHFWFSDDNFVLPSRRGRERVLELADALIREDLGVSYRVLARADALDDELLIKLRRSGLTCVYMGIESGSPRRLAYLQKRTDPALYRRAISMVRRHRIGLQIGFIMFDPLTSWQDLETDACFLHDVEEMYLFTNYAQTLMTYPGTPIAATLLERGLLPASFSYASGYREYHYEDPQIGALGTLMHQSNSPAWVAVDDLLRRLRMIDLPGLYRWQPAARADRLGELLQERVLELNERGFVLFSQLLGLARQGDQGGAMTSLIEQHLQDTVTITCELIGQLRDQAADIVDQLSAVQQLEQSGYPSSEVLHRLRAAIGH